MPMSSQFVCRRCARKLSILQGQLSRSYVSVGAHERRNDDTDAHRKLPIRFGDGTVESRYAVKKRAKAEQRYQEAQKSASDQVLEALFSSKQISSEQSAISRYSGNPIAQGAPGTASHTPVRKSKPPHPSTPTQTLAAHTPTSTTALERGVLAGKIHPKTNFEDLKDRSAPKEDFMSRLMIDMDQAVKRSNADLAGQVWARAKHRLDKGSIEEGAAKLDNLYTQFLSAFFGLRRAEMATLVWNHMVLKGHKITRVHWTAMLHGCIRAHDLSSLQQIWDNMRKSNITPDTATWTTYIRGLIKCRQWRQGIDALEQLGRVWKSGADNRRSRRQESTASGFPSQNHKPTPSLAPVNAALDALIDIGRYDLLDPVLRWASSHNLNLDTHTYNILLKPIARNGDPTAIQTHLTNMSTNNCQPDITTFTIIISSLVSSSNSTFHSLPPSEQETTIFSFLNDMCAAGIAPNTHTYSALISALLQPPSPNIKYHPGQARVATTTPGNISAARTVLAHMYDRSIPPSPHIYTILLSHYFSQTSPDLEAIHSLWSSIKASPLGTAKLADPMFYDRMIEGLADAGQGDDSLGFVRSMVKEGKVPGWVALGRCLESLYQSGERGKVQWLVEEVEREGGLLKWGERELRGKGWWSRRVAELRSDGVVPEKECDGPLEEKGSPDWEIRRRKTHV